MQQVICSETRVNRTNRPRGCMISMWTMHPTSMLQANNTCNTSPTSSTQHSVVHQRPTSRLRRCHRCYSNSLLFHWTSLISGPLPDTLSRTQQFGQAESGQLAAASATVPPASSSSARVPFFLQPFLRQAVAKRITQTAQNRQPAPDLTRPDLYTHSSSCCLQLALCSTSCQITDHGLRGARRCVCVCEADVAVCDVCSVCLRS